MNGIEIVIGGFIAGFFFIACCYFIKGLFKIYKKLFNGDKVI